MTIDWTKPIETADGRPARVIATDIKGDLPILVAALKPDGTEVGMSARRDGSYLRDITKFFRNVSPATATIVRYFNVYRDGSIVGDHESRADADKCCGPDRIACVRVEFKEGQFDG